MAKLFLIVFISALLVSTGCKNNNCVATAPRPDCVCTEQYDPVCGCNKKTYSNACFAACEGITEYKQGECK